MLDAFPSGCPCVRLRQNKTGRRENNPSFMTLNLSRLTNRKTLRDLYSAGLRSISVNEECQSRRLPSFLLLVRKHPAKTRSLKANYYVQIVFRSICVRICI